MFALLFVWFAAALAVTLPGVPDIPLDELEEGGLVLADPLPAELADAGAEPGWALVAVDDLVLDDLAQVEAAVARGPARDVRFRFELPDGSETILVTRRQPLVVADRVAAIPWPGDFVRPSRGLVGVDRGIGVTDADQVPWVLDPTSGQLVQGVAVDGEVSLTPLFWELSAAPWAVVREGAQWGDRSWAEEQFAEAARLSRFQGDVGEHLVVADGDGIEVFAVRFPAGTPALPTCSPSVPETCLASGRQILDELGDREGADAEALRQLDVACAAGVYRACFEADAVSHPEMADDAVACVDGPDTGSCLAVARARIDLLEEPGSPSARLLGELDFACEAEATGTLGERLRRLEEVGEGCMLLSAAYDEAGKADQALLALDRACVLGRAEACEDAEARRAAAFAARTVRECEDEELPIAPSCVELGRLLQTTEIASATLDDFGAFLRACNLGATEGCIALGDYVDRWGIDNERVRAAEDELLASCEEGELRACMGAGHLLVRHDPRSEAYGKALQLFDEACEGRIADACVAGAEQRRIGMARKVEAPEQLAMWGDACKLNDPGGCKGLGDRQVRERSMLADAFASYTRACDLGSAPSCSALGPLVERRHDPPFDGEQPPDVYLGRGCDNGDPEGCYWLAEDQLPKKGEPPEPAYLLLERSCEGSYGDGCAALAQVHLDRDTSFDDEIAARHLQTACDNGTYESCKTLGQMYLRGKGVERDRQKANELLERFRLNADRKHLRLGATVGMPIGVGPELEVVVPIPIGPALSVYGQGSYVPGAGAVLFGLRGFEVPEGESPALTVLGGGGRLYPNPQARGLYGAAAFYSISSTVAEPGGTDLSRLGWTANIGLRTDSKLTYTSLEIGVGQYGLFRLSDFDEDQVGEYPLLLPSLGFSFGFAAL